MDLAVIAAFSAAGLSLVNVVISARLASRGSREQWRREQERPIVARCITLSDDTEGKWWESSVAMDQMGSADAWDDSSVSRQHWDAGWASFQELRFEVAQLDLLASQSLRRAAGALVREHEREAMRLVITGTTTESRSEGSEDRRARQDAIKSRKEELIDRARADLGLGSRIQVAPGSILGKMLSQGDA